jgi:hypothetical protein
VDGVYVKAGLEKEKAALLGAVASLSDGRKVVVAGPRATGNRRGAGELSCGTCGTAGCRAPGW